MSVSITVTATSGASWWSIPPSGVSQTNVRLHEGIATTSDRSSAVSCTEASDVELKVMFVSIASPSAGQS
jgi:hypothetical protein